MSVSVVVYMMDLDNRERDTASQADHAAPWQLPRRQRPEIAVPRSFWRALDAFNEKAVENFKLEPDLSALDTIIGGWMCEAASP